MPVEILAASQQVQHPILAIENDSVTSSSNKMAPLASQRYTMDKNSEEQMRKVAGAYNVRMKFAGRRNGSYSTRETRHPFDNQGKFMRDIVNANKNVEQAISQEKSGDELPYSEQTLASTQGQDAVTLSNTSKIQDSEETLSTKRRVQTADMTTRPTGKKKGSKGNMRMSHGRPNPKHQPVLMSRNSEGKS